METIDSVRRVQRHVRLLTLFSNLEIRLLTHIRAHRWIWSVLQQGVVEDWKVDDRGQSNQGERAQTHTIWVQLQGRLALGHAICARG